MPAPGILIAGLALLGASGVSGTWRGQDGRDLVGPWAEVKPSEVQDIHIVIDGLPPARTVTEARVSGSGSDEWQYQGKSGHWAAALERAAGSRRADIFVEPSKRELGRPFTVRLFYDDGSTAECTVRGRFADPNLRMPGASVAVTWAGQEPSDRVSAGPSVGPDGLQDVRLALRGLSSQFPVKSIQIVGPGGARWQFGVNLAGDSNAELVPDPKDPSHADLFLQPAAGLDGRSLKLTVTYAHDKVDTATFVAGPADPARKMPPIHLPEPISHTIEARWLGQDDAPGTAPGDVHVALAQLPAGRSITAAALSDAVHGYWVYRSRPGDQSSIAAVVEEAPLALKTGADPTRADLFFSPLRNESERTLTLRLVLADGSLAVVRFPGGPCDPNLRVADPKGTEADARPGEDLQALVDRHRTVHLAPGTYRLSQPLVLNQTVALLGTPGATLLFEQGANDPPWPAAITVHGSRTTLDGFAVRFAGPVRWKFDVNWGPAVIGATLLHDPGHTDPKIGLILTNLDLEAPPAADPAGWVEAPRLLRLVGAASGRVAGNRFKGGPVEFCDGPWEIVDNDFQGTQPGTVSPNVFAAHCPHDLVLRLNRARDVGPSGKTWRFLVMTGNGSHDRIEGNKVVGIGPRDDDTIPPANCPEVVLTEAYHLHFEGKPAAISPDGLIVGLGAGQPLGVPQVGSVVAVLAGSQPGRWRRISQVLDRTTLLLDAPLPPGTEVIGIASGFVNETFARNTIDSRGSSTAANLILAGNHYGTAVVDNHLLGAGDSFMLTAFPSESPGIWGWSHAPFLGGLIAGNTIEDAHKGATLGVMHSEHTKSNRGRTYLTALVRDNTFKWTPAFLLEERRKGMKGLPPGLVLGMGPSLDPGELLVQTQHNMLDAPVGSRPVAAVKVHAAIVNGNRTRDQVYTLVPVRGGAEPAPAIEPAVRPAGGVR